MSRFSWRRGLAAAVACASLALLGACGSSSTESAFTPTRLVSFGDAFSDLGQNGGGKYTVNGTTDVNHWLSQLAQRYGRTLTASTAGGLAFGTGSARITQKPDPAGSSTTPTVTEQIDQFLASGAPSPQDLVLLGAGVADIVAEAKAFDAGSQTEDQMMERLRQAGRDLATQVRRLVTAGATHVVVAGAYNVGFTPWAKEGGARSARLENATLNFNDAFKIATADLGQTVLYVDSAYYFNLLSSRPGSFSLNNAADPVCTSVDSGPGIGLGTGQINSALCTTSTVLSGVDYNTYAYADLLYPAPRPHRLFGDYAYDRIRNRW